MFAPIPMASVATTRSVNIGARTSRRKEEEAQFLDTLTRLAKFPISRVISYGVVRCLIFRRSGHVACRADRPMRLTCRERSVPGLLTGAVVLLGFSLQPSRAWPARTVRPAGGSRGHHAAPITVACGSRGTGGTRCRQRLGSDRKRHPRDDGHRSRCSTTTTTDASTSSSPTERRLTGRRADRCPTATSIAISAGCDSTT